MIKESHKPTSDNCFIFCHVCDEPISHCLDSKSEVVCPRCDHTNIKHSPRDTSKAFGYALTALVLYFPANMLPFMTFEMYGNKNESTIWEGIMTLANGGSWFLAIIIFIASMLVPFIKLFALFYLSLTGNNGKNQKFKTKLFHFIEIIGPWSMLDIFLLAVLVAVIKFDSMASVTVGEGSLMFLLVVIFTMLASANFDAKIIWKGNTDEIK